MDNLDVREYLTQSGVLIGKRHYEEALAVLEKAETIAPMNTEVLLGKGVAYANMEKWSEAKSCFEKVLKINRGLGIAYFHLGTIAVLEGDIALGFEQFNKAVSNGYDDAQLYYSMGLLYEEQGEADLALRNYSKAIQRDALRPDIRVQKAMLLMTLEKNDEAIQVLDETILTNPDIFEGYHLKFTILLGKKEFDKAEAVLKQALSMFSEDIGFMFDEVKLSVAKDRYDEALKQLDEIEKTNAEDVGIKRKAAFERAKIYAIREDSERAISGLEELLAERGEEGRRDSEMLFILASCYAAAEQYEKLLECSKSIIENGEGYYKNIAMYYSPLALMMLGRKEEAKKAYEEAIREYRDLALRYPGNMDAYLLRMMCHRDLKEYEKALEIADYVLVLQPENPDLKKMRESILEERDGKGKP